TPRLPGERGGVLPGKDRGASGRLPRRAARGGAEGASEGRGASQREPCSVRSRRGPAKSRGEGGAAGPGRRGDQRRALSPGDGGILGRPEPVRGRVDPRLAHVLLLAGDR